MSLSIENIIQKHSPSLFKICLGYSKSVEEAEDTLQEVLINVWKGLARFREDSNIKTWLYRITVNTCLLKLRKKTIKTISLTELDDSWFSFETPSNAQQESFEQLHQFIQGLPVKDKSIILLYLEELSHQEIASIVGITPNYVGVKINRIKQTLSNKMKCHG
jgi:RNA polymerase sigma factor, sigma-70 family